ncbi:MAG: hypothetical protein QMD21_07650, partial [Candidatus Thermoplasmatota archaeon]|nr:hypothetical protein [Candidatus Thermoplasmatota archaeon]
MSLRKIAVGVFFVVVIAAFVPLVAAPAAQARAPLTVTVTPSTLEAKARTPGYVVYNFTIATGAGESGVIDLEAKPLDKPSWTNWTVTFMNISGVPLTDTNDNGKVDLGNVPASTTNYAYLKIMVPGDTGNGTSLQHRVWVNLSTTSVTKDVTTICDSFTLV